MNFFLKHFLLLFSGILAFSVNAGERIYVDILELSDGTILKGYINIQTTSDTIEFTSFESIFSIPEEFVSVESERHLTKVDLTEDWLQWLNRNEPDFSNDQTLALSDIYLKPLDDKNTKYLDFTENVSSSNNRNTSYFDNQGSVFEIVSHQDKNFGKRNKAQKKSEPNILVEPKIFEPSQNRTPAFSIYPQINKCLYNVHILEVGVIYKIVDLKEMKYQIPLSEIKSINSVDRDPLQYTGLKNVISIKGNITYSGRVISQIPGRIVRFYNESTQRIISIEMSDIIKQERVAMDSSIPLLSQSPLIECVYSKEENPTEGVIISQEHIKGKLVYTVLTADGTPHRIGKMSKIIRWPNPDYHVEKEILLDSEDAILVNQNPATYVEIQSDSNAAFTTEYSDIQEIEMSELLQNNKIVIYSKADVPISDCQLVQCRELEEYKTKKSTFVGFHFSWSFTEGIRPDIKITPNGYMIQTYTIENPGLYMLYPTVKYNSTIMFKVKK